jgi:uncharacterized protein (DUF885 family)
MLPALALTLACAAAPGRDTPAELDELARAAYEVIFQFHPVSATANGFHAYDARLGHYTPGSIAAFKSALNQYCKRLEKFDTSGLNLDARIDRELLLANLKMELFRIERLKVFSTSPNLYADECVQGIYYLLLREFAPLPVRAQSVVSRMAEVPQVLAEARQNVRNPPRFHAQAAIEELRSGEELYAATARDLGMQVPELKAGLELRSRQAIDAMRAYRQELEQSLGSCPEAFAMGRDNYNYVLRTDHFLPFDSDSLLRLGENAFRATGALIRELEQQRDAHEKTIKRLPEPFVPASKAFTRDSVVAAAYREADSMRGWTERRAVATVPDYVGRLAFRETPGFLRPIIPGIAMEPPAPFDSVQTSYYYFPPLPETLDSAQRQRYSDRNRYRGWRGGIVHEGYPGHHLQLSIANHHPSFIRRLQGNTPLIEGWALYCEQMVVEKGLYPRDSFSALRWLGGVRFRAARVILDVKLHTGRMTYADAVRFMLDSVGTDTAFAQGEVRRYCLQPCQPMSYLVGKLQILAIREQLEHSLGAAFDLREFHDRLLAEGSIPVSLIQRKLLCR